MNQFVFTLKDNNLKAFNTFFWFLYFLHLVAASVFIINAGNPLQKSFAAGIFIFILVFTAAFYLLKHTIKLFNYQILVFALMIIFWPLQSAWLPAIVLIAVIIFAVKVLKAKNTAAFTAENVVIKRSLFKKIYPWPMIDNVVLKDGLLSVDLKNNELIQLEPVSGEAFISEQQFNQFCQQQLIP